VPSTWLIIRKECLMFIIHIVDLVALVRCIWFLLCFLICWNSFQQIKMCRLIYWMDVQQIKRLVVVVLNCDLFNQLIYFLIDWFHLSQVKSTYWFGNQPAEFRNSLTISVVIFKREVTRPFLNAKLFYKPWNSLSFVIIRLQLLKIDLWLILGAFSLCLKLGEGVCGR